MITPEDPSPVGERWRGVVRWTTVAALSAVVVQAVGGVIQWSDQRSNGWRFEIGALSGGFQSATGLVLLLVAVGFTLGAWDWADLATTRTRIAAVLLGAYVTLLQIVGAFAQATTGGTFRRLWLGLALQGYVAGAVLSAIAVWLLWIAPNPDRFSPRSRH